MPAVSDIMSPSPQVIGPEDTLRRAARMMKELDVGALPVCNGKRVLGMITDRDIAIRGVATGMTPDASCVSDVMSTDVKFVTEDQDSDEVMRMMGDAQVRRVPVVNQRQELVGILSLGDLALRQSHHTDRALREISEPSKAA
ncbi:MAG TPA: CBS domain-containing protein [Ideonella sp.]|uniref:CBS domain-containing protein n=1 Tax=Ideonella sp. TaxID=1929293 RepID=UPI002E33078F|nr:CBS domain-containing protein [Ideonella sp.]HEX5684227.1 CBS domain-containing protein [Ideonella sp.]